MVVVDTSAWIEFLNGSGHRIVNVLEHALDNEVVCMGDLVYCEILQGIRHKRDLKKVKKLFHGLARETMAGFEVCEKAADNYRHLRSKGVTVRKTIDVIIGTFCLLNGYELLHNDRDFEPMQKHLGLQLYRSS